MDKNRYALLYGYLLARIYFGFYPKGKSLPSIYRLSDMFGVSTITSRGAMRLLKKQGYIDSSQGKRSTVIFARSGSETLPDDILAEKETMQDLFQSLYTFVPCVFYQAYVSSSDAELLELENILDRFNDVWDEQTIQYLYYLVQRLKNPLLNDLYADTLLYSYPAHLLRLSNESGWEKTYENLRQNLRQMLDLRKENKNGVLWNKLRSSYLEYDQNYATIARTKQVEKPYTWGKPVVGHTIAREVIYRIYCGIYPVGTFLPSPKILAKEFSTATITIRRAISLLNKLGVTESINGKGTKVLSMDEGRQKIKWTEPSVRRSIMTYFYALHIFAITVRSIALVFFCHVHKGRLEKAKKEILVSKKSGHSVSVFAICMAMLIENSHLSAIRTIYVQLENFLLWGYPLVFIEPRLQLDEYANMVVAGIDSQDATLFAEGLEQIVFAIFKSSKRKIISVGIKAAEDIPLPAKLPLS